MPGPCEMLISSVGMNHLANETVLYRDDLKETTKKFSRTMTTIKWRDPSGKSLSFTQAAADALNGKVVLPILAEETTFWIKSKAEAQDGTRVESVEFFDLRNSSKETGSSPEVSIEGRNWNALSRIPDLSLLNLLVGVNMSMPAHQVRIPMTFSGPEGRQRAQKILAIPNETERDAEVLNLPGPSTLLEKLPFIFLSYEVSETVHVGGMAGYTLIMHFAINSEYDMESRPKSPKGGN